MKNLLLDEVKIPVDLTEPEMATVVGVLALFKAYLLKGGRLPNDPHELFGRAQLDALGLKLTACLSHEQQARIAISVCPALGGDNEEVATLTREFVEGILKGEES
jgi:hypothetical protein